MQRQHRQNNRLRNRIAATVRATLISSTTVVAVLAMAATHRHKPNDGLRHQMAMTVLPGFLPALEFARTGDDTSASPGLTLQSVAGDRSVTPGLHDAAQESSTFDANAF